MLFQKINHLITHKRLYHLCNMTDDRYWTIIIFVINVAIIFIDRRHSGVLPILLKDSRLKGFIYHRIGKIYPCGEKTVLFMMFIGCCSLPLDASVIIC